MSNIIFINSIRFISVVLIQIFICNNINFLGYINPMIYIYFILVFPIKNNRSLFLILAFLLGLTIDVFSDSGGINAAASLCIAYIRPFVLQFAFGVSYEYQAIKIAKTPFGERLTYISVLTLIHHLVVFILSVFNISNILLILKNTLFFGIFTILLLVVLTALSSRKNS